MSKSRKKAAPAARPSAREAATVRSTQKPGDAATGPLPGVPGISARVALTQGRTPEAVEKRQAEQQERNARLAGAKVGQRIRVEAIDTCYDGFKRRRAGERFTILAEHFSARHMTVTNKPAGKSIGPNDAIARETNIERNRRRSSAAGESDEDDNSRAATASPTDDDE